MDCRLPVRCTRVVLMAALLVTALAASAQTFLTLHSFDGTDGANPEYV